MAAHWHAFNSKTLKSINILNHRELELSNKCGYLI